MFKSSLIRKQIVIKQEQAIQNLSLGFSLFISLRMEKDKRYKTVKLLIEDGHITQFNQIFEYVPKSKVASDLGTNYNRLTRLISHVDQFVLRDLFMLSKFIEIDGKKIFDLVYTQYTNEKNSKRKK